MTTTQIVAQDAIIEALQHKAIETGMKAGGITRSYGGVSYFLLEGTPEQVAAFVSNLPYGAFETPPKKYRFCWRKR